MEEHLLNKLNRNMKYYYFFILLLILPVLSCDFDKDRYEKAVKFELKDFQTIKDLTSNRLEFDSLIMQPMDLVVYDSLLITVEVGKEKIFHVYNLNTKTHINQCINRGQGPEDMLQPEFMNCDEKSIRIIDLATSSVFEYELNDFITNQQPKPKKRTKLEKQIFLTAQQVDNKIMGCSYAYEDRLYIFDSGGKKINSIINYPARTIQQTNVEKTDAYYMKFITNNINKIALCYYMTDLIEIYNLEGVLEIRLHGPEQFFSYYKEYQDGKYVGASPIKGFNRDAYMCPRNAINEFFVLYNGGFIDTPNHTTSCNQILSFTWDGIPRKIFNLNDPIFSFNVDSKNKKIFGISEIPEFHIVEYSYE